MQLASYISELTGLPVQTLFNPAKPLVKLMQVGQTVSITYWDASITAAEPTAAALQSALAAPEPNPTQAQLAAYASSKQAALRDGGITVNVGTASTSDEVNVASDVNGRSLVSGSVQLIGLASSSGQPAPTFNWINDGGTQLTLTSAQMMTIGLTLGNFVQATYTALGTVLAAIANGTLTSTAAIDAAAWPKTSF